MLAVKLDNIGKKFIISHEKEALIRHLLPKFLRIKSYEELWALNNINLEIEEGLTYGIIGRNGAGKTTLLNVVSGITFPTRGKVYLNGKVSTLLSLGAGFHPELTGEENIYINGSILGLKIKEIKKRFKQIVDFSELGDFISAPLQTYSAGMYMRLGFSIAINVDFDILLMDEILAVGDISFQNKCLKKLRELQELGKTIMMVSQSLDLLNQLCHKTVLLDKGEILSQGITGQVTDYYKGLMSKKISQNELQGQKEIIRKKSVKKLATKDTNKDNFTDWFIPKDAWGTKSGTDDVQIIEVKLLNRKNKESTMYKTGENMKIKVKYIVHKEIDEPHFGVAIFREDGTYCFGPNTKFDGLKIERLKKGEGEFSIEYKSLNLLSGKYRVSVAIWEKNERFAYDNHYALYKFEVIPEKRDHGILYLDHKWRWRLP